MARRSSVDGRIRVRRQQGSRPGRNGSGSCCWPTPPATACRSTLVIDLNLVTRAKTDRARAAAEGQFIAVCGADRVLAACLTIALPTRDHRLAKTAMALRQAEARRFVIALCGQGKPMNPIRDRNCRVA